MKSDVIFIPLGSKKRDGLRQNLSKALHTAGLTDVIKEGEIVAVKTHFGERGNTAFIKPIFISMVINIIKKVGGLPFLTDTNTLYIGSRGIAVTHLETAYLHGFLSEVVGAPVIIADGLRGGDGFKVEINGKHLKEVEIAKHIAEADSMIVISHFKGHDLMGFGASLKNIGMGCSTRKGKLKMHSNVRPFVIEEKCTGCKICMRWCPVDAIQFDNMKATIDDKICIGCAECIGSCQVRAIDFAWDSASNSAQEMMVEHAYGVIKALKKRLMFINFVIDVVPNCDCYPFSGEKIVPDIGILISRDPVAIDKASYDLVNEQTGLNSKVLGGAVSPGKDKIKAIYPHIDGLVQIRYAEKLGLGCMKYNIISLEV
ncbi:MAG: DUF362 domain-containing protein [bacterium]